MVDYFKKRKMKKQFQKEGLLPPDPVKPFKERYKDSKLYKGQKATYGFIDDLSKERRKGKRRNPFGKIKDRSITQGFF